MLGCHRNRLLGSSRVVVAMTLFLTAEGRNPKRKLGSATFGLGDAADSDLHWAICIGRSALGVCELGVCELGVCELGL